MTKLLHDRLRNPTDKECNGDILADAVRGAETDCSIDCKECFAGVMKDLADEIERCYIPRTEHEAEVKRIIEAQGDRHDGCGPSAHHIMKTYAEAREMSMENESITEWLDRWFIPRPWYEDGEPVQFGDEYQADNGTTQKLEQLHCFADGGYVLNRKGKRASVKPGGFVKSPSKVLDADGVAYEAGQTVWRIRDGKKGRVIEVCPGDHPVWVDFDNYGETWCKAENLTHKCPVFDAEGARIRKGDTVWHASGESNAWVVERIGEDGAVFCREENDSMAVPFDANRLTHREPNSLEKLLERMEEYAQKNEGYIDGSKVGDFSKELRAFIERGA